MASSPLTLTADQVSQLAYQNYRMGNLREAQALCERIIASHPTHRDALRLLWQLMADAKNMGAAANVLQHLVTLEPDNTDYYVTLGDALNAINHLPGAVEAYQNALKRDPSLFRTYNNLGGVFSKAGFYAQAIEMYKQAIALKPDVADMYFNLATSYVDSRIHDGNRLATEAYEMGLKLKPDAYTSYIGLGNAYKGIGQIEKALECYNKALAWDPEYLIARWAIFITYLPVVYISTEEVIHVRQQYAAALNELDKHVLLDTPRRIRKAAEAVGSQQPFFLAYQGCNDKDLQRQYGEIVNRVQAAAYPQWAVPRPMPPLAVGERIRVGILSRFFSDHSNWKIPIRGWVSQLDRNRFELFGYSTGGPYDESTNQARQLIEHFCEQQNMEFIAQKIIDDRLHILILPETGMDPYTLRLAALRLAPIQCTSWGHPQTSGLSTVDYFLSSDLMEPENGQDAYTETLVRLPNLSIYYESSAEAPEHVDLAPFGVKEGDILYLCCQILAKYLPKYDALLAQIAKQVPTSKFLFITHPIGEREPFYSRAAKAFTDLGLNADNHIIMFPYMRNRHYASLCKQSHVFLDTVGWSGCNSTLEALEHDTPIVTFPGEFMRGRHTLAIMKMIDVPEAIADSLEDYVAKAIHLGQNSDARAAMSQKIAANRHRVYRDKDCIRGLEDFITQAVQSKL